jgi:hypothetical protein
MNLRRALFIAAFTLPAWPAAAQIQPQQMPPCVQEFMKLRTDAEHKALAIKTANEHKATAQEACRLFKIFSAAEAKLIKYATDNNVWCGIPPEAMAQMKQGHAHTEEIRTKVCQIAAAPPRPAGPSLSDALSAPVPDANNIKTGRGTYDTLTGSPLGAK